LLGSMRWTWLTRGGLSAVIIIIVVTYYYYWTST
jgi:hypothetical protein